MNKIFSTEKKVLRDFQDQNPSQYYSNQKKLYKRYKKNFEYNYTYLFKLPLKLFNNCWLFLKKLTSVKSLKSKFEKITNIKVEKQIKYMVPISSFVFKFIFLF